jgi:hypothetical protein
MPLALGTRLGPYEILAPIGAGGIGEVYRANDTRLDRTVAIKVLPEHLPDRPERRQRFEREARAIGKPVPVTLDSSPQEFGKRWPQFLPDGRDFLFLVRTVQPADSAIHVSSLEPNVRGQVRLFQAQSKGVYAPPGYLLFVRGRSLTAQPFDAASLRLQGDAILVAEQVGYISPMQLGDFSASANGVLVYGSTPVPVTQLTWYSRDGKPQGGVGASGSYLSLNLSPDQKMVAVWADDARSGSMNIRLVEVAQISTSGGTQPRWRPDGRQLFYLASDGNLMAVEVREGDRLEVGASRALFRTRTPPVASSATGIHYAVASDGQRFLVNSIAEDAGASPITVVVNWTAGLKK